MNINAALGPRSRIHMITFKILIHFDRLAIDLNLKKEQIYGYSSEFHHFFNILSGKMFNKRGLTRRGDNISDISKVAFLYVGDIRPRLEFSLPVLVKNREVQRDRTNKVMMDLNHRRHFLSLTRLHQGKIQDIPYSEKMNRVIFRGEESSEIRMKFVAMYWNHSNPNIDVKFSTLRSPNHTMKPSPLSISDQLKSKYIVSLE
jgi:hypothetical protein